MANPENKQIPYESTQKDIRDAIESVATAIGGIAIPSADHVSYDNSGSGLSATDVQDAIDELESEKVDKEADKGLSTNDYTDAEKAKLAGIEANAEVNVQSDWNEADNTKDDYIKNKPSSEVKSATDTFTTVNGGLLEECIIKLEPVQSGSGDPSPDNVRPISGHTEVDLQRDGKNLFDASIADGTASGVKFTVDSKTNPKVTLSGTWSSIVFRRANDTLKLFPNKSYIISGLAASCALRIREYDSSNTLLNTTIVTGTTTLTINANTDHCDFYFVVYSLAVTTIYPMIRKSTETDPTFEPYLGNLYQVQIGSTVYGGYVDLVSGVMVADRFYFSLNGTENFSISQAGTTNPRRFNLNITNAFSAPRIKVGIASLSSHFKEEDAKPTNPWGIFRLSISGANMLLVLPDANSVYATTTDVENYFATQYANGTPAQFSYVMDTPFTIQLTPQQIEALVGQNNLSTPLDGQSIDSVEYREIFAFDDVEKVVSLRVPISMLGTDESGRTTASQAYASGDYFYKDGYMCKALTSISAGATLTLNTNYSQGTLADILKAIENA